jgi:hypothetical protein
MKKTIIMHSVTALCVFLAALVSAGDFTSSGYLVYEKARTLEQGAEYSKALELYRQAKEKLVKEGRTDLVNQCRYAFLRIEKIMLTYPHDEDQVRQMIKDKYADTTDARIDEIINDGRLPQILIGGKTYYFDGFLNTLYHIYPDFRTKEEKGALGRIERLFDIMSKYIYAKNDSKPGQVLFRPITYEAKGELTIERDKLPEKGLLKLWMPLPLVTAAQPFVEIIKIYPDKYIVFPVKHDGDIGLAYMEIPLEQVKEHLRVGVNFKLTHYEERFNVDPEKIGQHDKDSSLYKRYTASDKNIAITPAIRATAQKISGKEANPYIMAKKFYDHVVYDLEYSHMPHAALEALGIPESVYVAEHGYGDCRAQSIYFSALCRSMGIPARSSGGMQLFPNPKTGSGTHFWAQIYLPNYGWIPVDTSVGQLAKYMPHLTKKQRKDFIDYFFGKMDPFRYLIQVDVDVPFIPRPDEPLAFNMVLREPTAVCREMDRSPGLVFLDKWKIIFKQISNGDYSGSRN